MKILVTGAAGFIAFHLIERLLKDGHEVIGVDNFDPYYDLKLKEQNVSDLQKRAESVGAKFQLARLDFTDWRALDVLPPVDVIVHLGAKAGVRPSLEDPQGYILANVLGTQNMLEWAKRQGVRRFIFGSSSSVYGNSSAVPFSEIARADQPISPYAATKRSCELLCESAAHLNDMKICSLRFFTVYGPRQRPDLAIRLFLTKIHAGEPITLYGDGSTARDYTWVDDIVSGVFGAIEYTAKSEKGFHEIFNLGGSQTTTLKQLVEEIEKAAGVSAKLIWRPMQPGDVEKTYADTNRAKEKLGYSPTTTIENGIAKMNEWYRQSIR